MSANSKDLNKPLTLKQKRKFSELVERAKPLVESYNNSTIDLIPIIKELVTEFKGERIDEFANALRLHRTTVYKWRRIAERGWTKEWWETNARKIGIGKLSVLLFYRNFLHIPDDVMELALSPDVSASALGSYITDKYGGATQTEREKLQQELKYEVMQMADKAQIDEYERSVVQRALDELPPERAGQILTKLEKGEDVESYIKWELQKQNRERRQAARKEASKLDGVRKRLQDHLDDIKVMLKHSDTRELRMSLDDLKTVLDELLAVATEDFIEAHLDIQPGQVVPFSLPDES